MAGDILGNDASPLREPIKSDNAKVMTAPVSIPECLLLLPVQGPLKPDYHETVRLLEVRKVKRRFGKVPNQVLPIVSGLLLGMGDVRR